MVLGGFGVGVMLLGGDCGSGCAAIDLDGLWVWVGAIC